MVLFKQILKWTYLLVMLLVISAASCQRKTEVLKSPPGYDFSKMEKSTLDLSLREISGLAWDPEKNEFAAINDEKGRIFFLDKESKFISGHFDFGGKGDYEDVAFVNSVPYVLKSDGSITRIDRNGSGNSARTLLGTLEIDGGKDFESLYYDPSRKALILLCKNCGMDNRKTVSAFAFYLDSTGFDNKPVFRINAEIVDSLSPRNTSKFQPSGAAIHPIQQKLYILSSASNQLVVTDLNGNVENVFVLAANFFPQPEGICFKLSGDMYITNEGGSGRASLLKFAYLR